MSREKIANVVEVCNVPRDEAIRVLESCNMDATVAIDRFLNGLESGWSEVSKKKKPSSGNTNHAQSGGTSRGGSGSAPSSQSYRGGRQSGRQNEREKDHDRSDRDRGERDRTEREFDRDRNDRERDRERQKGGGSAAQNNHHGHQHGRSYASGPQQRGRHAASGAGAGVAGGVGGVSTDTKTASGASPMQILSTSTPHAVGFAARNSSTSDSWAQDAVAPGASPVGQSAADSWVTSAVSTPSVADSWGDPGQPVQMPSSADAAGDMSNPSSLPLLGGLGGATGGNDGQPEPVSKPAPVETRRSINYAAAAAVGTSHAKPAPPRPVNATAVNVLSRPEIPGVEPAPTPAPLNDPNSTGKPDSRSSAPASGAGDAADAKKRRNRGGRKHRTRLEAIRAVTDESNATSAPSAAAPVAASAAPALGSTGAPSVRLLPTAPPVANGSLGAHGEEDGTPRPLQDPIPPAPLEAAPTAPSAWSGVVPSNENSTEDVPSAIQGVSLSVAPDAQADSLSLQFGSFGLGNVDWSPTADSQTAAKSIVSVAPVVPVSETSPSTVPSAPVSAPIASSSANLSLSGPATGIPSTDVPVPPTSVSIANNSTSLMGIGGAPPTMPPVGGGGAFAPSNYGAPGPYGMMPLGYTATGLPTYEGTGDLKGLPPQPMTFFDPSSLPTGLPTGPGKFGGPGIPDMGLLPPGPPGSSNSKLPGMDLDKNTSTGHGGQGAIPDMYMMGYPPQNVGYPPLYGFAPNPYTGGLPPGSMPPPGSNPYGYGAYPAQNPPLGGGKYGSNNQSQGGRGNFGFDDASGMIGPGVGRNSQGLNDSIYAPVPGYLSAQIPDSMMGSNSSTAGMSKSSNPDAGFKSSRGSSTISSTSHVGGQSANQASVPASHGVSGGIPSMYGSDYSVMNTGPAGSGSGWIDVNRNATLPRDSNNPQGMPQASSGMYTPAPPTGYWTQGGYY